MPAVLASLQGDVLEVSAGTGRNLKYYDLHCGVQSLTLTDGNKQMLQTAYDKFRDMGKEPQARVRFTLADAQSLSSSGAGSSSDVPQEAPPQTAQQEPCFGPQVQAPAAFAPQQFDYVVDTFGLCSCDDPVQALKVRAAASPYQGAHKRCRRSGGYTSCPPTPEWLQEMARVCKPGGRLLLLEHGRGSWNFVNGILDGGEEAHCKKWGCKWNRPIAELVAQAGLDVESLTRWHFGTTYVITARPKQVSQAM